MKRFHNVGTLLRGGLALTLVFGALACSDDDDATNNTNNQNSVNSTNNTNNVADMGADMEAPDCPAEAAEAFDPSCSLVVQPCQTAEGTLRAIKQALIVDAADGDTVCLTDGNYALEEGISVDIPNLTILGESRDGTVLDFANQTADANGILATSDGFTVRRFTVKNTAGDGIRVTGATGVTFSEMNVTWDGGPDEGNGAYGIYPVQCENVLVENSVVSNASDAGIYVGQSETIIVRDNEVFGNVAGIEIENSSMSEVMNNNCHDNTGGILIFDLPDLPVQGGQMNKIHNNTIVMNNEQNFAPEGNIVGEVPTGTGILVLASDFNEIHDNVITGNGSLGIAIASYNVIGRMHEDENFDPVPEGNYVHDNEVHGNGQNPDTFLALALGALISESPGVEDLVWDGETDPDKDNTDGSLTNCFENNVDAMNAPSPFLNADAANDFLNATTELGDNACQGQTLESVSLP